jgi:type II secretory pathway pseudopilin PulG
MKNKNKGIGLIETIIAIVILASAFVAGEYFLMASLSANQNSRTIFVATYLAQECLELARNVRDSSWQQQLSRNCAFQTAGTFSINSAPTNILNTSLPNCETDLGVKITPFLPTTEIKILGDVIPFSRKINITPLPDGTEVECVVKGPKDLEIKMTEILTEWKK